MNVTHEAETIYQTRREIRMKMALTVPQGYEKLPFMKAKRPNHPKVQTVQVLLDLDLAMKLEQVAPRYLRGPMRHSARVNWAIDAALREKQPASDVPDRALAAEGL